MSSAYQPSAAAASRPAPVIRTLATAISLPPTRTFSVAIVAIPRLTRPAVTRSPARGDTSHNEREPSSPPGDQSLNDLGDDVSIGKASFEREKGRYRRQRNDPGQGLAARENSIR